MLLHLSFSLIKIDVRIKITNAELLRITWSRRFSLIFLISVWLLMSNWDSSKTEISVVTTGPLTFSMNLISETSRKMSYRKPRMSRSRKISYKNILVWFPTYVYGHPRLSPRKSCGGLLYKYLALVLCLTPTKLSIALWSVSFRINDGFGVRLVQGYGSCIY